MTLNQRIFRTLMLFLMVTFAHLASAKRFTNAYISFELPPNWNCRMEGAEWVCENEYAKKLKEAIIILTAKEIGPSDSIPAYMAHLQTPSQLNDRSGALMKSKVIRVTQRTIGNQLWVDGLHESSEISAYFTRYLATVKDRISILLSFTAHKESFAKYSNDFQIAIESMRVVATKDLLNDRAENLGGHGGPRGNDIIGGPVNGPILGGEVDPTTGTEGKNKKLGKYILFALILGGAGAYLYMQSKKSKKK